MLEVIISGGSPASAYTPGVGVYKCSSFAVNPVLGWIRLFDGGKMVKEFDVNKLFVSYVREVKEDEKN